MSASVKLRKRKSLPVGGGEGITARVHNACTDSLPRLVNGQVISEHTRIDDMTPEDVPALLHFWAKHSEGKKLIPNDSDWFTLPCGHKGKFFAIDRTSESSIQGQTPKEENSKTGSMKGL